MNAPLKISGNKQKRHHYTSQAARDKTDGKHKLTHTLSIAIGQPYILQFNSQQRRQRLLHTDIIAIYIEDNIVFLAALKLIIEKNTNECLSSAPFYNRTQ
jgi:hypothetical protein